MKTNEITSIPRKCSKNIEIQVKINKNKNYFVLFCRETKITSRNKL